MAAPNTLHVAWRAPRRTSFPHTAQKRPSPIHGLHNVDHVNDTHARVSAADERTFEHTDDRGEAEVKAGNLSSADDPHSVR